MYKQFYILSLVYLLLCSGVGWSQNVAEIYFNSGASKYTRGDVTGAIADLDESYRISPQNVKTRQLLVRLLLAEGIKLYQSDRLQESLLYINRVLKIDHQNEQALTYRKTLQSKLFPQEPPVTVKEEKPVPAILPPKEAETQVSVPESAVVIPEKKKSKYIQRPSLIKQSDYTPNKSEDTKPVTVTVPSNLPTGEPSLPQGTSTVVAAKGNTILVTVIVSLVIALAILVPSMIFLLRDWRKRETVIQQRAEHLLKTQHQSETILAQGKAHLVTSNITSLEGGRITLAEMLKDANPRIRAKGVEVMELELEYEDPKIAEELLTPYLTDTHNRVRGNAVKVLFRFNPEKAKTIIQSMVNDEDKWMRSSAAWVAGEVCDPDEAYRLLNPLLNDSDFHIKRRVLRTLQKLREKKETKVQESDKSDATGIAVENKPTGPIHVVKEKIKNTGYGYVTVKIGKSDGRGEEKLRQEAVEINEILTHPQPRFRAKGLELLEPELRTEPTAVVERLLQPYLDDSHHRVRATAAKIFYSHHPQKALNILTKMAGDKNVYYRLAAIWAFSKILNKDLAKEYLEPLTNDPNFHVRYRAISGLYRLENLPTEEQPKSDQPAPPAENTGILNKSDMNTRYVFLDVEHRMKENKETSTREATGKKRKHLH